MPNQDYGRGGTLDKYEYKIRAEEIKTLISQKKYVDCLLYTSDAADEL